MHLKGFLALAFSAVIGPNAIMTGVYRPGTVLSQKDLAGAYGVNRIPVRDALQSLAAEKLVEIVKGKGARIPALSNSEVDEIYDLRVILECDLLARAITQATAQDHADVKYARQKSSLEAGRAGWQTGDWRFHAALYQPANRPRQTMIVDELRKSCVVHASHYAQLADQTDRWIAEHDTLANCYVERDLDKASEVLRHHILDACSSLRKLRDTED